MAAMIVWELPLAWLRPSTGGASHMLHSSPHRPAGSCCSRLQPPLAPGFLPTALLPRPLRARLLTLKWLDKLNKQLHSQPQGLGPGGRPQQNGWQQGAEAGARLARLEESTTRAAQKMPLRFPKTI